MIEIALPKRPRRSGRIKLCSVGRDHLVVATATLPPVPVRRGGKTRLAGQDEPNPRILGDMPGNVDELLYLNLFRHFVNALFRFRQ